MDHIIHYDPGLPKDTPTPCYVVDLQRLKTNLEIIDGIQKATGCRILCALKGFAMHSLFPMMRPYLAGVCASGPHEARLGAEVFQKEVHVYTPAFSDQDIEAILPVAHKISFNSLTQWQRHKEKVLSNQRSISCGLRINPEHSEIDVALYDPCAEGSRLGIKAEELEGTDLAGIEGLHFHTLCEQGADTLARTLDRFTRKCSKWIPQMKWVNFGGGHHITSPHYDRDALIALIKDFQNQFPNTKIYLEPGEAIALNTGVLATSVLDIQPGNPQNTILDISATCHMPDTLEMPYRPEIFEAGAEGEKAYNYRLGGLSCLAGDVIGLYSFDQPLQAGDKLYFLDMAHYTMVKTTTFNGIKHPSIATWNPKAKELKVIRSFGYEDYKGRLS